MDAIGELPITCDFLIDKVLTGTAVSMFQLLTRLLLARSLRVTIVNMNEEDHTLTIGIYAYGLSAFVYLNRYSRCLFDLEESPTSLYFRNTSEDASKISETYLRHITRRRYIAPILAMAYRKNRDVPDCYIARVPKEILLMILDKVYA